eukprot:TRINITY_DN10092_c0_g1_i1.p1 TRINITY_DN10092_c0_g1~~TRINITY_DN10092_c0_g1_i1.p1  ORF type:complete len:113 (-),score=29.07 TRINITY_DN10092_c0_g1_i1:109-447(-)
MGCGGGKEEEPEPTPPPKATPTTAPKKEMDLDAILNMNKVNTQTIPEGFPPAPEKLTQFPGGDETAYKDWMRRRMKYEQWENSLTLYRMREKDGNTEACRQIIDRLKTELAT